MKSAAENINSPNRFELLNCETTEKDENNQSYDKDTSIVYNNTVNPYCNTNNQKDQKKSQRDFHKSNMPFRKNVLFLLKKRIKKLSQGKTSTTHTNNIASLGKNIISFNRGIKSEFNNNLNPDGQDLNTSQELRRNICCTILTLL